MQKGRRNRRALEDREAYPWLPGNLSREALHKVLFEGKRAQLGQISSIAQFKKGENILFRRGGFGQNICHHHRNCSSLQEVPRWKEAHCYVLIPQGPIWALGR